jgi:hypothetical protein
VGRFGNSSEYYELHPQSALAMLRVLAQKEQLTARDTTFYYNTQPQLFHERDVKIAFIVLSEHLGHKPPEWSLGHLNGLVFRCRERLFAKIFAQVFIKQKLFPTTKPDSGPGPLPTLFIGREKTQVRQIPLADERPWPFKFLLELGGMIVCKAPDKRDLLLELRQYLNNFPQFRIKVHAEEWPAGEILIVTTWFQTLELQQRKKNVNVPT